MSALPVELWMQGYLKAWASDAPEDIAALFTEDARYYTEPDAAPWEGREAIVREWIARSDSAFEWSFTYDTLAEAGDLAVVQGHTHYGEVSQPAHQPATDYENLWVIRFAPDGRAREFTEWWMQTGANAPAQPVAAAEPRP